MSEDYPSSVIPCFGLHPWDVEESCEKHFVKNDTSNVSKKGEISMFPADSHLDEEFEQALIEAASNTLRSCGSWYNYFEHVVRFYKTIILSSSWKYYQQRRVKNR
ncbi:hypothetical protein C5167_042466 [Papaver somniferum]|uniref:Uncharacterized protein n=1 Tax=Papaver somniferum TaxID=3469 RepID=A0A4Y7L690_PAPSO|nr:hypothetical protein C5167_042466 [Papaver somniferum]